MTPHQVPDAEPEHGELEPEQEDVVPEPDDPGEDLGEDRGYNPHFLHFTV